MRERVVVLADTHLRPGRGRRLPDAVYEAVGRADAILHAGDVITVDLLDELSGFAPVLAVRGNNDVGADLAHLPETRIEVLAGVRIAMVHDSGPVQGRAGRLHRRFPTAAVVVFGHSHVPWNETGVGTQLLFNPGSPTARRAQPHHTFGLLILDGGRVVAHEVVAVEC